jgi:hypothetical protein
MSIKVYAKRGKHNYKEKRLAKELQEALDIRRKTDPEIAERFMPATSFEELQGLHRMYVSQEVEYEDIDKDNDIQEETTTKMAKQKNESDGEQSSSKSFLDSFEEEESLDFVDPFNREEPIVRDYVTEGGISMDSGKDTGPTRTQFDEPVTFEEAFVLPSDDDLENNQAQGSKKEPKQDRPKRERQEPVNPSFDDMSSGKKKRSTKKFAKYIVEVVCMLASKGLVWFANKDINEAKLAEYELNGEMDLSILVTLEQGQEITVKQFFQSQCLAAEEIAKIDEEEKSDLADTLAEVLLEKGVAPTPMQELMLISFKVFGEKAIMLLSLKSQTSNLLSQLRSMGGPGPSRSVPYEEPIYEQPVSAQAQEQQVEQVDTIEQIYQETSELEIDQVVETKE